MPAGRTFTAATLQSSCLMNYSREQLTGMVVGRSGSVMVKKTGSVINLKDSD